MEETSSGASAYRSKIPAGRAQRRKSVLASGEDRTSEKYLVWSNERRAWVKAARKGYEQVYTRDILEAYHFKYETAVALCSRSNRVRRGTIGPDLLPVSTATVDACVWKPQQPLYFCGVKIGESMVESIVPGAIVSVVPDSFNFVGYFVSLDRGLAEYLGLPGSEFDSIEVDERSMRLLIAGHFMTEVPFDRVLGWLFDTLEENYGGSDE